MSPNAVHAAVFPLRVIFWGGLLCIFDFSFSSTTNGEGFKFDILNDAVGMFIIAWGVFQLRNIPVNPRYTSAMGFVAFISVLAVLDAVREHFIVQWPQEMVFALNVFSLVCLGAIVVFCLAMRWFCEEAGLWDAVASWRLTTALFIVIYVIPLGFFYLAVCYAIATGTSFHIDLGLAGLLLLPVFAIPLIHLFISTSRMAQAAEETSAERPYAESHSFRGP